jgi:hypothetical protein
MNGDHFFGMRAPAQRRKKDFFNFFLGDCDIFPGRDADSLELPLGAKTSEEGDSVTETKAGRSEPDCKPGDRSTPV